MATKPPVAANDEEYMRPKRAAAFLDISQRQFYRLRRAGRIPAPIILTPHVHLYPKSALRRLVLDAAA